MDPELIAYLDERFGSIDERFRETSQQIQGLREETSQQIQGLRAETSQQIQGLREETSQRFNKMEEQLRLTDVKVEALHGRIQLVAEGVASVDEKLEAFRDTVAREFEGVRMQYDLHIDNLNRRVRDLELRQPKAKRIS